MYQSPSTGVSRVEKNGVSGGVVYGCIVYKQVKFLETPGGKNTDRDEIKDEGTPNVGSLLFSSSSLFLYLLHTTCQGETMASR